MLKVKANGLCETAWLEMGQLGGGVPEFGRA